MARDEAGSFSRGETFYNGGTIDANDLGGVNLEGREYRFEVGSLSPYTAASSTDTSGREIICRIVRNVSSIALKPKKVVKFKLTNPSETQVDGYTSAPTTDFMAGVVDEYLPAAGVPINDLFYIVVEGPTQIMGKLTGQADLAIGDKVSIIAGTTSVHNDAGRVDKYVGTTSAADAATVVGRSEVVMTADDTATKVCVHFKANR